MTNDASRARWRRAAGGFTAAVVAGLLLAAPSFASALGAASGIGSALPSHLDARLLYSGVGGAKGHLDHVVIVMLENHVYDTYFANYCLQVGAYCPVNASGIPPGTCEPLQPTTPDAGCVRPFNFTPTNLSTVDLPHSWQSGHSAYANGSLNDFYQAEGRNLATFGHFNGSTIPTYWDIAEQYAIGDNFFASALSYSTPNHWYMVAAAAPNESLEQGLSHLPNASLTPSLDAYLNESNATPSIVPELNNASVSWSYYDWNMTGYTYNSAIHGQGGENNPDDAFDYWSPLAAQAVSYTPSMISHFKAFKTFNTDALAGRLPNVSWVVTNPLQSDHPPYPTNDAEDFVASLVNAVAEGPDWNTTAIFVTWDDYGGFYDNVPPPQIDAAGVSFRAPLLVVGPYVRQGYVNHQFGYFESFLRLIEWRFHVRPLSARDADAPLPLGYFDFNATPRAPWLVLNSSHSVYPEPLQGLGTPPAPQSLTAVGGPGSVTLNWTVPAGGAAPTTFVLQYGPPANPNQSMIRVDGYVNSATVTDLSPGVLYQFSLRSLTGGNTSSMAFVTAKPLKGGPKVVPPNAPANWESLAITGSAPSARLGAAFSENPSDGSDLLFGGATSTGGFLGDTWEYVGGKWTQITGTAPSARAYAALAYDAKDRLLVLFGGRSTSGYLSDTWTFSGGKWANLTTTLGTAGSPPARAYAALVEDSAASFLLLFGGRNSTSALSDTWTFVASKWTPLSLTTHPASRSAAAAAYDALDKEVLLYGGNSSTGAALNDTWRFSSGAWSQVLLGTNPGGRIAASAVFDARDGYLLLFGGKSALGYAHGTWTFAGGAWKTITPGTTPVLRIYAAATYDEIRQSVLWGFGQSSSAVRSDLWAYSDPLNLWPTAAPTYGPVPMTVGFAPYVTGGIGPLSYLWNFGDGQNATLQFPSHIYTVVGYYNATLTVTDAVGLHVGASIPVHVMGDLSVGVSASTPSSNGTVKFTSTVGGGWHPYSYLWNFGDGKGSSTLADPTYRYALHLSYRATVTVTDAEGDVALASIGIVVPMPLPTAVSANVTEGSAPLAVAFALPEAAAPGVYLFEFGDGTQEFSMSGVVHTFTAPGAYRTIAILTGRDGGVEYVAPTIQVLTPLSLSVDVPILAVATGALADLSASVGGGLAPYQVTWLLPDGTTLTGTQVAFAFAEPGAFAVEVIVADSMGSVVTKDFTVRVVPVATPIVGSFSAEPMTVLASGAVGAAPVLPPPVAPPSSAAYATARWTTTPAREQQRPTCSPSSVEATSKVVP